MKPSSHFLKFAVKILSAAVFWLALFPSVGGFAKIYKYKDDQGKTHFTDDASKIPLKFRKKDSVKKYKGVNEPPPSSEAPPGFPGRKSTQDVDGNSSGVKRDEGFSPEEEAQAGKSIQVLQSGVALSNRYKDVQRNFSNTRGIVDGIQSGLPQKISLANELEGTQAPVLQEVLVFLKKSIAIDRQTKSAGAGLKTRIVGIFNRVADEGKQQTALIQKLTQALKDSEKSRAEAAMKKKAEAQSKKKK